MARPSRPAHRPRQQRPPKVGRVPPPIPAPVRDAPPRPTRTSWGTEWRVRPVRPASVARRPATVAGPSPILATASPSSRRRRAPSRTAARPRDARPRSAAPARGRDECPPAPAAPSPRRQASWARRPAVARTQTLARHRRCIQSQRSGCRRMYISSTSVQRCVNSPDRIRRIRGGRLDGVLEDHAIAARSAAAG